MTLASLNKVILRSGLSIAAALLLSTAAFAQDAVVGDDGTVVSVGPAVDTGVVQNWDDINPGDDQGIAVGEPDPNGDGAEPDPTDDTVSDDPTDGGPDIVIDDGLCIGEDCTSDDEVTGDGEVTIYTLGGDPSVCIECNGIPVRGATGSEVERGHTAATVAKRHSAPALFTATTAMAQCLNLHPRSVWICEWQNGAGQ